MKTPLRRGFSLVAHAPQGAHRDGSPRPKMLLPPRFSRSSMLRATLAFLLAAAWAALPARAFPIFGSPPTIPVVEYYNTILGHYFLTADSDEMYNIEHGTAGPGWTRTGWIFQAYHVGQNGNGYSPGCVGPG